MTATPQMIKLEFQYTEEEYLAASRLYIFQSLSTLIRLLLFLLLVAAFFLFLPLIFDPEFPVWATLSLLALMEAALLYNLFVRIPRRYFRGDGKFSDRYELTFTDEGIAVKTRQIDSKLAWSLYTKVVEGDSLYLLIYGKDTRTMTVVPRRAFHSKAQEAAFREMLHRHVSIYSAPKQISEGEGEEEYKPSTLNPPDWR